jgi:outer membrane protein assembly factor BamB
VVRGRVTLAGAGLAAVAVSDGLHVVLTGADGGFELPGTGPFVFLTRPTGLSTDRWFQPVADEVAFELSPVAQPVPFTFAQVTDLHLSLGDTAYGEGQGDATLWVADGVLHDRVVTTPSVLADLFSELAGHDPAFVVATGDLTNNGTHDELAAWSRVVAEASVPVVAVPGNHDHHSAEPPDLPYERHLGPRWFSFDHGGVHFAAIDWFTWRLRLDTEQQEAWLAADLAVVPVGTPVVLLTHDQMDSAFYDRLPVRPVASCSGHWHTTRVVESAGTVHVNTGTATFGGLDYSPAHYRLATWDGTALTVRTVTRGPAELSGATMRPGPEPTGGAQQWAVSTGGGAHLAGPVLAGEHVLVVSRSEDRPAGTLECRALTDGALVWQTRFASSVKAEPLVCGDAVVASSVSGETVCVDLGTGAERWRRQLDDPLRPWVHLRPATDGRLVFVGDVGCFAALSLETGDVVWSRDDLGQRENLTSFSHPLVVDGRLLVAFAGQTPDLWALDAATGATLWPDDARGRSIYSGPDADLAAHLPRVVVSGLTPDPGSADVYLVRLGSSLERVSALTGERVWAAPFSGWFNPAAPVVWDDAVLATEGSGRLFCFGRDGSHRWTTAVGDESPLAMGSYRADGAVSLAPPVITSGRALIPTGDGRVLALEPDEGRVTGSLDVGVPVTGRLAVAGAQLLAVGVDGVLRSFALEQLGL